MTHAADRMTLINERNYQNPALVRQYLSTTLRPAEVMMFVKHRDEIAGRRVLDIGCGAGRVTRYLAQWTPHVTGIDFSGPMIDHCRRVLPHVAFAVCDVRDLTPFADGAFDVVLFTFNGIDTLPHDSRLAAFAGLRRILRPGGLYLFSSHNRRYRHAHDGPRLHYSRNPLTQLGYVLQFGRSVANRRTRKPLEREEPEYAIINDIAHDFCMVHYYIDRESQAKQLAEAGFELLETFGENGAVLRPADDDSDSGELYYVTRRTPASSPLS
jgi:SAM-dependent methyltransferase